MTAIDLSPLPSGLLLGTSSFSSPDWRGGFYPPELPAAEFLRYYATRFPTVEIDATWHAMPSRRVVQAWAEKVPPGFVISAKAPKLVTHERYLEGCAEEWSEFLSVMDLLGENRGPILLQFPYVPRTRDADEYRTAKDFLRRLAGFLPLLPDGWRFAVEVRNRTWLKEPLLDLLRGRGVALALSSITTMPSAGEIMKSVDPVTAGFAYIRFLGDHKAMDQKVSRARHDGTRPSDWCELISDRSDDTRLWIPPLADLVQRVPQVFAYFNNHYAGFAPGSLELFVRLWKELLGGAPAAAEEARVEEPR